MLQHAIEAKSIIKRLSRVCTTALEAAVVQCVNARHYEVTVEHLLLALLDDSNSDVAFLVMHYDLDPARLRQALQRSLSDLRTGNAGKPVFSPTMLEWMQDAWTVGSVEYGFAKVRSGMLFSRLLIQTSRYTMSGIGALLEGISRDDIKTNLQKIVSGSKEEGESLLNRTMILYGSNLGNAARHDTTNLPILLAGGGFHHGRHLAFDNESNKPLSNLFVTMLHRLGIETDRFSSSTGSLSELETRV